MESNWQSYSLKNMPCKKMHDNVRGEGGVKAIICLLTIGLSIYAAIGFGLPYYKYLVLKDDMEQIANITVMNTDKLRQKLMEQIASLNIPIKAKNIKVLRRHKGDIFMRASWRHDVYLFGRLVKTYNFKIQVGEEEVR